MSVAPCLFASNLPRRRQDAHAWNRFPPSRPRGAEDLRVQFRRRERGGGIEIILVIVVHGGWGFTFTVCRGGRFGIMVSASRGRSSSCAAVGQFDRAAGFGGDGGGVGGSLQSPVLVEDAVEEGIVFWRSVGAVGCGGADGGGVFFVGLGLEGVAGCGWEGAVVVVVVVVRVRLAFDFALQGFVGGGVESHARWWLLLFVLSARLTGGTLLGRGGAHEGIVGCRVVLLAIICLGGHGTVLGLGRRVVCRGRWGGSCGTFACDSVVSLFWRFLVAGKGDVGGGLEELLPELGAFPDIAGVFCIFLDHGEDTGGNDTVGTTEVVVDFYGRLCQLRRAIF